MSVTSLWGQLKLASGAGILEGGYPFAPNIYYVGDNASPYVQQEDTIADALTAAISGDIIILGPQTFQEGNLVLPAGKDNVTIIGASNKGSTIIAPLAAGDEGLQILSNYCTLINVSITKGASADYALSIGSSSVSVTGFRAQGCKFYGLGGAAIIADGCINTIIEDCEIADCTSGIVLAANVNNEVLNIVIKNNLFRNFVTVGIGVDGAAVVAELNIIDNIFTAQDDGTAPTDFLLLSSNNHFGIITGNKFAYATNATGVLTIGTGLMWVANATEAGYSTARPA